MFEGLRPHAPALIAALHLRTSPRWLNVRDINSPRTGLEVKFSYAWLATMVLPGVSTASDRPYSDALAADPGLAAVPARVTVTGDTALSDMRAQGELTLSDGRRIGLADDLAAPIAHGSLSASLQAKDRALIGPRAGAIWQAIAGLDSLSARDPGAVLRQH